MSVRILTTHYGKEPGNATAFYEAIAASGILEKIRAEEGCIRYCYYAPVDKNDLRGEVLEEWASPEAEALHLTQPWLKDLNVIKMANGIEKTTVEKFEVYATTVK